MISTYDLCALIERGGILYDVEGNTIEEVYTNTLNLTQLPDEYNKDFLKAELLERERILSTAVGNGIAIPHTRKPLITKDEDQRIIVSFLKNPLNMGQPDDKPVSTMFFLLNKNNQLHLQVLSTLAKLIHDEEFRAILEKKPQKEILLDRIKNA